MLFRDARARRHAVLLSSALAGLALAPIALWTSPRARLALHVECIVRGVPSWRLGPTCPYAALDFIDTLARRDPALLVPLLDDDRKTVFLSSDGAESVRVTVACSLESAARERTGVFRGYVADAERDPEAWAALVARWRAFAERERDP